MKKFLATVIMGLFLCFSVGAKTITLTDQNTISLNGRVDAGSMTQMMLSLQELNKIQTDEPIYLVINSPGGSIYDGFDFIRFASTSKRKINTISIFAASMAFQLVEALGDRYVTPYSTLMSHKAKGGFEGEFPGQLDSRYAHVLSHLADQDKVVVNRTKGKQTLESYSRLIQNEYWANSDKAVNDGFADEEVNVSCDKSLEGTTQQTVDLGFFAVDVVLSKCPLITQPLAITTNRGGDFIISNKIDVVREYSKIFSIKNVQF
jgi:ATP-dependent Clp protease protease subunit